MDGHLELANIRTHSGPRDHELFLCDNRRSLRTCAQQQPLLRSQPGQKGDDNDRSRVKSRRCLHRHGGTTGRPRPTRWPFRLESIEPALGGVTRRRRTRCGRLSGPCQYAIWREHGSRTFEEKDGIEFTPDVSQMLTHTHLSSSGAHQHFCFWPVCSPRQPTPSRFPDLVDPFRTAPHAAVTMPSKELPGGASRRPPAAASAEFPRVSMRAQVRSASSR